MLDLKKESLILVVDDTPINLSILSDSLKKAGFQVSVETDGESAIEQVAYNPPDLILLDVIMPGMDGFETCLKLKSNPETKDIPIIFMTALAESTDKVKGLSIGAVDYIIKPFQQEEVIARVQTHLKLRKLSLTLESQNQKLREEIKKKIETEKQLNNTLEQLKKIQQQIIAQEKLASLGSLTAGIAHELRNPLNFINNFAEVSLNFSHRILTEIDSISNLIPSSKLKIIKTLIDYLQQSSESIYQQGKQADCIIRSMLLHARGDTGKFERVDINQLIEENLQLCIKTFKTSLPPINLQIDSNYDPTIGKVMLNPQSFSRGIINILNNAVDELYSHHKKLGEYFIPKLSIATSKLIDTIEITVKDNGSGIPPTILNRVFEPFFTTKLPGEGTGLGLSIAYDIIVNEHQGNITIDSHIGEYTKFIINLPDSKKD
jgi:signal transduction histidine kinase